MNRILGIDYGSKRIGIAISDPLGLTAQPQKHLVMGPKVWTEIRDLIAEKDIQKVVVGIPLAMSGNKSAMTLEVESFCEKLRDITKLEVIEVDERLSSKASERLLIEADVSRKKRKSVIDSMAASMILQSYLDTQS
ncbi:MAG: Holliday junction resolvase RuvX [Bdellovibrionales bacterium]|nr:Holliday junction resolvase RuvX [Bdellovibrionales bacterium]